MQEESDKNTTRLIVPWSVSFQYSRARMKLFVLMITLISCADHCCGERSFIPGCGKPPVTPYLQYTFVHAAAMSITFCLSFML